MSGIDDVFRGLLIARDFDAVLSHLGQEPLKICDPVVDHEPLIVRAEVLRLPREAKPCCDAVVADMRMQNLFLRRDEALRKSCKER